MKIKTDYVTNSSSTSYIIICDGDFTRDHLSQVMGIKKNSPLFPLVDSLYDCIWRTRESTQSAWADDPKYGESFEGFVKGRFSPEVLQKVIQGEKQGKEIWVGYLSSEDTPTESLFCCDSFEWENDRIYINALNCVW